MKTMEGSGYCPITWKAEVDETVFGGQEHGVKGRENKKKKLVVVCTGKKKRGSYPALCKGNTKSRSEKPGTLYGRPYRSQYRHYNR